MKVELEVVDISKPAELNVIIGHSHFIKTVEDVYEALIGSVPNIKFGIAFCEASGKRLIRLEGNDSNLKKIALKNSLRLACGHTFFIALDNAYPVNVLNQIKNVPEVCRIFCATANPLQVIIGQTSQGRAIMAVVDGLTPLGVETESDVIWRKELLRKIKYKL